MNKFWYLMMLASICVLTFTNPSLILSEMISTSSSIISLCVELCAIYTVWLGFLELVDKSGLGNKIAKVLRPLIRKIIKVDDVEVEKMIALNLSANIMGLGNAATPAGMKAVQMMDKGSSIASTSIIMLIILNSTSLQLLPTTIIGLRESAGSMHASDIILPTLCATIATTLTAITLGLLCEKIYKKRRLKR